MRPSGRLLPSLVGGCARLLPREFRERVFEPAWTDLQLEEAAAPASPTRRFGRRVLLILECLRIGLPQYLWYRGRPTRTLRVAFVVVVLLVAAAFLVLRTRYT